ncbi:MAG TPA: aldolase/citrate lyase family protein [Pyrinomonadaceae bacterium]|nr:aldolase/citrate lyase family protein [Pyrinomonadaceae bacterium]
MSNNLIELANKLFEDKLQKKIPNQQSQIRNPVHVVYGGADRFSAETPSKFGKLALQSIGNYAPNFVEFAKAMWLKGCDTLPIYEDVAADLEFKLIENAESVKKENYPAWFAWTIYNRVIEKLKRESIEDFRIDFEDGYGVRSDEEEDSHTIASSNELAKSFLNQTITIFCGFRIKSFQTETFQRAVRTLELFLSNLLRKTNGVLPENFVVTLPKITCTEEVTVLGELLAEFEKQNNLVPNSIKIEIMIETPEAILKIRNLAEAAKDRILAAHFGAYDYTASFGITAVHQHLKHDACNFARNVMQNALSPLGIRLSDSVTTEMPVPIHKGENLTNQQLKENKRVVHQAWRLHFNNVTHSLTNGFYQSWDLHPAQLVARYAAVYAFFLESFDEQKNRLKRFLDKATKATMSGNQFDDAASAQGLLNYCIRAVSCGALSESEVLNATTLSLDELNSGSFVKIMEGRI